MPTWLSNILPTVGTLLITLAVTLLFNKLVGLPKELKRQKAEEAAARQAQEEARLEAERQWEEQHQLADLARDARLDAIESSLTALEAAINALPGYRAQSLQIQQQLQSTDQAILSALTEIKGGIKENQDILNTRLDRLEDREKNAIRAKLLDEYRLFTDEHKNPMLAWSEMEHHAFFKLLRDYEDLHGNDYVHDEVLPAMNRLNVIKMSDRQALLELMSSRRL